MAYFAAILLGTRLLMLPAAAAGGQPASVLEAAFTATSAICITGLAVVDTESFWSPFGQVVILVLIQVGGFGIVTIASFLARIATGRIPLRYSLLASRELHQRSLARTWRLPVRIAVVMLVAEAVTAIVLTLGFVRRTGDWGTASWYGGFHAISAFNNAGFALFSDSLIGFVGDPMIILPICLATVVGGIGFPVLSELRRSFRTRSTARWSIHARLTIYGTLILLVAGILLFGAFEWTNPATLGPLPLGDKLLGAVGGGVFPRTVGFNSVDYGAVREPTVGLTYLLMFIGGGSVSTAGGVKVGTIGIIIATVVAEVRGESQAVVSHRAIASAVQRSAMTVILLGVTVIGVSTAAIGFLEPFSLQRICSRRSPPSGRSGCPPASPPNSAPGRSRSSWS